VASHEASDLAVRPDVLVCRGAVLLLRARRKAGVAGVLARDVDRLLTAASLALETDAEAIPTAMRYAVVQFAEHLVQRCTIPVPRGVVDGSAPPSGRPCAPRGDLAQTDHRRVVPYCGSMRLGRMG
jgi:hypothetical protein